MTYSDSTIYTAQGIVDLYTESVQGIEGAVEDSPDRASGGVERARKGALVERLARGVIGLAWSEIGGLNASLSTNKGKKIKVTINESYLERLADPELRQSIKNRMGDYTYGVSIDVPVYIEGKLAMAVECKAYTENAMLKRILVDGWLVRNQAPDTDVVLLQLESMLGGDYSEIFKSKMMGSTSTHTLMSYFDYPLKIITLLEGERKVNRPIHDRKFFKEMSIEAVEMAIEFFKGRLERFVK